MAGTALENFTDFVKFTGPAYFTSADQFLNEAVNQTYALPRFLKGKSYDRVIQGGATIKDDVMFDEANTYQRYKPNAEFTWSQPQVATEQEINWRFSLDHMSWTDQEVELNMDDGYTRAHAKVQYKRMRKKIEQRMWTSMLNGMEEDLWASPHNQQTEMESSDGTEAYSIPAFVTEETTAYHPIGWTTIMGIDPANEAKWRNQVSTYDYGTPYTVTANPGSNSSLIQAFDDMWLKVRFIPPAFHQEHFESLNMQAFRQGIFCSRKGLSIYKTALREENDTLVTKQDAAYNSVRYSGIDMVYIAILDGSRADGKGAIFTHDIANYTTPYDEDGKDSAGTAVTEAVDGPRYWFINGNYLTPIFHRSRYFYKKDPYSLEKQPWTWVCPVDCWNNLFCHSRQRQGIVAPHDQG